jgi:hypothetical protein
MGLQRFYADKNNTFTWENGAVGYRNGSPFDCLGPYAKVKNCPVNGSEKRVIAYATGYADSFFTIPAACKIKGKYVGGFFTGYEGGIVFQPYDKYKERL